MEPYIQQVDPVNNLVFGGSIVLIDDMEATFVNWGLVAGGNGTVARSTTNAFNGNASLLLQQTATGLVVPATTIARRSATSSPRRNCELRFHHQNGGLGGSATVGFQVLDDTGLALRNIGVRLTSAAGAYTAWQIQTGPTSWTSVGVATDVPDANRWARTILKWNPLDLTYDTLITTATDIDISSLAISTSASAGSQSVLLQPFIEATSDLGAAFYLDNILFRGF